MTSGRLQDIFRTRTSIRPSKYCLIHFYKRMEKLKSEVSRMVDDLSVLGGTPHADCINLVHLELSNMVNTSETLVVNSKAVVSLSTIEGQRYRICHTASQIGGEGTSAAGEWALPGLRTLRTTYP